MKYITLALAERVLNEEGPEWSLENWLEFCCHLRSNVRQDRMDKWEELFYEVRGDDKPLAGTLENPVDTRQRATHKRFVLTCAQSNTKVHEDFLTALEKFCELRDAQLHISQFTYNKSSVSHNIKADTRRASDDQDVWYDPRIEPYVSSIDLDLADDLTWAAELQINPTAVNPITGLDGYARQHSIVIPHVKMHMQSFATMKSDPARFAYTTGTVTQRNYIEAKAGQKAKLHHVFGAILVEIDEDGDWFVRQLNWGDGRFYDLDSEYTTEGIQPARVRAAAITHGDIHGFKLDRRIEQVVWGSNGLVDALEPEEQYFHDILDFMPRNHHNIKDAHFLHQMYSEGKELVEEEFAFVARRLVTFWDRPYARNLIVTSNHDQAIETWLRNTAGFFDPPNMEFWLRLNHENALDRIAGDTPRPFSRTLKKHIHKVVDGTPKNATFYQTKVIHEDDSHTLCGDIEAGLHGHLGPNGARGAPRNLRLVGKANTGHTHSAGIIDGVYTCGVYGELDMGYNKGLSNWSNSCIVTYPNGKRTIITIKRGKWKA